MAGSDDTAYSPAVSLVILGEDDRSAELRARAFSEVLRPSFSDTELVDEGEVVASPGRIVVCAVDESEQVLAVAVSDDDREVGVTLLSYLASRPGQRGRGHGSALLAHLRMLWRQSGSSPVLAEVHDPRLWPESSDEHPAARLRFYGRHGCHLLSAPWIQPALRSGSRVAGMLLLVVAGGNPGDPVPSDRLLQWLDRYYAQSEGAVPDDGEFRALRMGFSQRPLAILSIDQLDDVVPLTVV